MSDQHDTTAIRARIARAESERDAWRAAGSEEKYLEAYVTVEALRMQLDERARHDDAGLPPT